MAWQLRQSLVREFFALVSPPVSLRGPWGVRGPDQQQLWTAVLQLRPLPPLCTGGVFTATHRQQVCVRPLQELACNPVVLLLALLASSSSCQQVCVLAVLCC
jgi:hypothetical protein